MRFKVGDVVVLKWTRSCDELEKLGHLAALQPPGSEGTVVKIRLSECFVSWQSGTVAWASFEQLELKRPPQTELGTWDAIERITGWHPEREVA